MFAGAIDLPVEIVGGVVCDSAPMNLPAGVSPDCQDVDFAEDGARTRPGLGAPYAQLSGNVIQYLKTFLTSNGTLRAMALTDTGNLYKEITPGAFSLVAALPDLNVPLPYGNSTTQFGKEWIALSDGKFGVGLPRQFDDTNLDRVSQCGPGAAPRATDYLPAPATVQNAAGANNQTIIASPNGIVFGGNTNIWVPGYWWYNQYGRYWVPGYYQAYYAYFTVTTAAVHGFTIGQAVTIAGSTSTPALNGVWAVDTVPSTTTFTVAYQVGVGSTANGGGGTASIPGGNSLTRVNNTVTAITAAAHGFLGGMTVQISGFTPIAIGGGISAISQSNGTATCTTASAHGLSPGAQLIITGTTNYNGTWTVLTTPSSTTFTFAFGLNEPAEAAGAVSTPLNGTFTVLTVPTTTSFTYTQLGPNEATTSTGTATPVGNIAAGTRQISVIFVTRQQYLTQPAAPATIVTGGGKLLSVSSIPIGPPNVIQRILLLTQAAGAQFFYLSPSSGLPLANFVIPDNVSTSAILDFTDGILAAGTLATNLFNQVELGECAGVLDYSSRLLWWGERAKVQNLVNLSFDGGFTGPALPNYPLGWIADGTFGPGGASAIAQGYPVVWGDAYAIVGNGVTATRGLMRQSAFLDINLVPIIQINTDYSIRARVMKNAALAGGRLNINLQSTQQSFQTAGLQLTAAQVTASYVEYTADLIAPLAAVPSDLQLQIYADQTPALNGAFVVDCIEIFPTFTANNIGLVRASGASNPESYDGVTGLLEPSPTDGQAMRACFQMRERVYLVKEHSFYVTQDDGTNEPANWSLTQISREVGTPSVRGVGQGEDWAIIAHRTGLYIFWGTEPQKISQEIHHSFSGMTLAWDQINWAYAQTMWVVVDTNEKRILVGAPFGAATTPNKILMMDYRKIDPDEGSTGAEAIASNGPIRLRYTGMKAVMDKSRKWTPWTPSVNSCALIERADGTAHLWMGAGASVANGGSIPVADAGAIYDVVRGQTTDYSTSAMIPSYYTIAFIPQREQNQQIQTHEHRKSFVYLTLYVEGNGMVNLTAIPDQFNTFLVQPLPSLVLSSPALYELEAGIDVQGERVAFKIANFGTASWFRLQKMTLSVMGDPWAPVRGVN